MVNHVIEEVKDSPCCLNGSVHKAEGHRGKQSVFMKGFYQSDTDI